MSIDVSAVCLIGNHEYCLNADSCHCECHGGSGVAANPVPSQGGPTNHVTAPMDVRQLVGAAA